MSDFQIAVEKTLANEGGYYHNPTTGEYAKFGITIWFLRSIGVLHGSGPAAASEIAFIQALPRERAVEIYRENFWNAGHFALLNNQQLANKCFDLGVNQGVYSAVKLLQQALNAIYPGAHYAEDGVLGPLTAAAANGADQANLYAALLDRAEARYRQIAAGDPIEADDLDGWLERLRKS